MKHPRTSKRREWKNVEKDGRKNDKENDETSKVEGSKDKKRQEGDKAFSTPNNSDTPNEDIINIEEKHPLHGPDGKFCKNNPGGPGRGNRSQEPEGAGDDEQTEVSLSELKQELRRAIKRLAAKAKPDSIAAISQLLSQLERLSESKGEGSDDKIINIISNVPRPPQNTTEDVAGLAVQDEPTEHDQIPIPNEAGDRRDAVTFSSTSAESALSNIGQPVKCRCGFEVSGNLNECPKCGLDLIEAGLRKVMITPTTLPIRRNEFSSVGGVIASGGDSCWKSLDPDKGFGGQIG